MCWEVKSLGLRPRILPLSHTTYSFVSFPPVTLLAWRESLPIWNSRIQRVWFVCEFNWTRICAPRLCSFRFVCCLSSSISSETPHNNRSLLSQLAMKIISTFLYPQDNYVSTGWTIVSTRLKRNSIHDKIDNWNPLMQQRTVQNKPAENRSHIDWQDPPRPQNPMSTTT